MFQWLFIIVIASLLLYRLLPAKGVTNITIQETRRKFNDKDIQFIDVRTPREYQTNHLKPFKNIPPFGFAS